MKMHDKNRWDQNDPRLDSVYMLERRLSGISPVHPCGAFDIPPGTYVVVADRFLGHDDDENPFWMVLVVWDEGLRTAEIEAPLLVDAGICCGKIPKHTSAA